ncbi:MAG TPA: glycosyl hydrolase [Bacteroidales bacterium]|nr:glycosyl hydrolase [Bacteroidales bacterium]
MKATITLLMGYFLLQSSLFAQSPNIRIGRSINSWDPNEPSVSINPGNTDEIMVGANANNYYFSKDGGLTWQHGVLRSSYGVNCDPVIVCDDQGSFYYFHLVPNLSRVVCQKMAGNSTTWSDGSFTALNGTMEIDKEWAAFDPVHGNLYVSWSQFNKHGSLDPRDSTIIYLARSEDRGITWSDKIRISKKGGNASGGFQSVHGSYPTTGPNGEVYVCWWSPEGLMFDKSADEGRTWLANDLRVSQPAQWIYTIPGMQLTPSFPVIACDRSTGRYKGSIYINWSEKRGGAADSDIWIINSRDGGSTWSTPKKVNNGPAGKDQFFNFVTIDQVTGYVYVLYYDRRNYSDNQTDVYMAISRDGGTSFENIKISDTPFIPYSTAFFGHYLGISAHNNKIFAAWSRQDNGTNSLWGASLTMGSEGIETTDKTPVSLEQNSPNPFDQYTLFSFKLKESGPVTVRVLDLFGRTVATLADQEEMSFGKHTLRFQPEEYNLAPGIYYYSLVTREETVARRMVYR